MVIGARTAADVVFAERFAALGARVIDHHRRWLAGPAGPGHRRGRSACWTKTAARAIYACGPEPMLEAVERLARDRSLPAQLSYERYMRCGFGVCGSCATEGWLVCRDGPVRHVQV